MHAKYLVKKNIHKIFESRDIIRYKDAEIHT